MTQGWEIKERLDHLVDAVVDSGDCGTEPTTVVDLSGPRAGDPAPRAPATRPASSSPRANYPVPPRVPHPPFHDVGAAAGT